MAEEEIGCKAIERFKDGQPPKSISMTSVEQSIGFSNGLSGINPVILIGTIQDHRHHGAN